MGTQSESAQHQTWLPRGPANHRGLVSQPREARSAISDEIKWVGVDHPNSTWELHRPTPMSTASNPHMDTWGIRENTQFAESIFTALGQTVFRAYVPARTSPPGVARLSGYFTITRHG